MSDNPARAGATSKSSASFLEMLSANASAHQEAKTIGIKAFKKTLNTLITSLKVNAAGTSLPNIHEIKIAAAAFINIAAEELSSKVTAQDPLLSMNAIINEYHRALAASESLLDLVGNELSFLSDLEKITTALEVVPETRTSTPAGGAQASEQVEVVVFRESLVPESDASMVDPDSDPATLKFHDLMDSIHTNLRTVDTLITSIGSQFNAIRRVQRPTDPATVAYYRTQFEADTKFAKSPMTFKPFEITVQRNHRFCLLDRLELIASVARATTNPQAALHPMEGDIGLANIADDGSNQSPRFCVFQKGGAETLEGESLGKAVFKVLEMPPRDDEEHEVTVAAYVKLMSSLNVTSEGIQVAGLCIPHFLPPTHESLVKIQAILKQTYTGFKERLETSSKSVFTGEGSTATKTRHAIEKATDIINNAITQIATLRGTAVQERDNLQKRIQHLDTTLSEMRTELDQSRGDLDRSRMSTSTTENGSVFNGSILASEHGDVVTPVTTMLRSTPPQLAKYMTTWLNESTIQRLNAAITDLSIANSPELITEILEQDIIPLIIGVFYPLAKEDIESKGAVSNAQIERMIERFYSEPSKNKGEDGIKKIAAVLLRLLCPEDTLESLLAHPTLKSHRPGSFLRSTIKSTFCKGLTPRPSADVMQHDLYLDLLVAVALQTDAKKFASGKYQLPIADFLMKNLPGQPILLKDDAAAEAAPATPSLDTATLPKGAAAERGPRVKFAQDVEGTPAKAHNPGDTVVVPKSCLPNLNN